MTQAGSSAAGSTWPRLGVGVLRHARRPQRGRLAKRRPALSPDQKLSSEPCPLRPPIVFEPHPPSRGLPNPTPLIRVRLPLGRGVSDALTAEAVRSLSWRRGAQARALWKRSRVEETFSMCTSAPRLHSERRAPQPRQACGANPSTEWAYTRPEES